MNIGTFFRTLKLFEMQMHDLNVYFATATVLCRMHPQRRRVVEYINLFPEILVHTQLNLRARNIFFCIQRIRAMYVYSESISIEFMHI